MFLEFGNKLKHLQCNKPQMNRFWCNLWLQQYSINQGFSNFFQHPNFSIKIICDPKQKQMLTKAIERGELFGLHRVYRGFFLTQDTTQYALLWLFFFEMWIILRYGNMFYVFWTGLHWIIRHLFTFSCFAVYILRSLAVTLAAYLSQCTIEWIWLLFVIWIKVKYIITSYH